MPIAPLPLQRSPVRPGLAAGAVLLALALLLVALPGCRHSSIAPGDPVAAVEGLAQALADDDLVRYSRLSVPPALYAQVEARWKAKVAAAPPPTPAQVRDYAHWMGRLTAPGAEAAIYADLDPKLAHLEKQAAGQWPMMKATAGLFINGVIQANDRLSPAEKAHFQAIGSAFADWATAERFTDRQRAKEAIAVVTRTARALDLPTLAQARRLEMVPAFEKAGVGWHGFKQLAHVYGIDIDAALDGVHAKLKSGDGDTAVVAGTYPLMGKTIAFEVDMVRRDGRWYPAHAVRQAEADLARAPAAPTAAR
jgi:hypothetical protein